MIFPDQEGLRVKKVIRDLTVFSSTLKTNLHLFTTRKSVQLHVTLENHLKIWLKIYQINKLTRVASYSNSVRINFIKVFNKIPDLAFFNLSS